MDTQYIPFSEQIITSDVMDNAVAICPNCHRKIHVLNDEVDTIVLEGIAEQNEKQYQRLLAYAKRILK